MSSAESQTVEGDLRREIAMNIKRLQEMDATEEFVIERACLSVVRRPRQMQEHVRVRERQ